MGMLISTQPRPGIPSPPFTQSLGPVPPLSFSLLCPRLPALSPQFTETSGLCVDPIPDLEAWKASLGRCQVLDCLLASDLKTASYIMSLLVLSGSQLLHHDCLLCVLLVDFQNQIYFTFTMEITPLLSSEGSYTLESMFSSTMLMLIAMTSY